MLFKEVSMTEARALAATGMLGAGFAESSLSTGLRREPHFIGARHTKEIK